MTPDEAAVGRRMAAFLIGNYREEIPDYGDVMTVSDFVDMCRNGMFTDWDGHGLCAAELEKGMRMDRSLRITPSMMHLIPDHCTHIVWFNK